MSDIPESLKSPHKLVLPENVSISALFTVILGGMGLKFDCFAPDKAPNSPIGYVRWSKISQKPT